MKLGTVINTSFILGLVLTIAGACLKITHAIGADTWLTAGLIVSIVFIGTSIYEVRTSKRIDHLEKTMWTLALIFLSAIAGLIYILIGRRRIASNS